MQGRLLLGVPGALGAARQLVVQLQPVRRGRGEGQQGRAGAVEVRPAEVPLLLQPIHEPLAVTQVREQALLHGQGQSLFSRLE